MTIMKPDIVFFGEGLPDVFHRTLEQDKLTVRHHYVYVHVLVVTYWQNTIQTNGIYIYKVWKCITFLWRNKFMFLMQSML